MLDVALYEGLTTHCDYPYNRHLNIASEFFTAGVAIEQKKAGSCNYLSPEYFFLSANMFTFYAYENLMRTLSDYLFIDQQLPNGLRKPFFGKSAIEGEVLEELNIGVIKDKRPYSSILELKHLRDLPPHIKQSVSICGRPKKFLYDYSVSKESTERRIEDTREFLLKIYNRATMHRHFLYKDPSVIYPILINEAVSNYLEKPGICILASGDSAPVREGLHEGWVLSELLMI